MFSRLQFGLCVTDGFGDLEIDHELQILLEADRSVYSERFVFFKAGEGGSRGVVVRT